MSEYLSGGSGSIFVQPDGPNSEVYWLGCHDMGDVTEPSGDVNREYCPDPAHRGQLISNLRTQGASGEVTFDITFAMATTADWLEKVARKTCSAPIYVQSSDCAGEANVFLDYERSLILQDPLITNKTRTGVATRRSDGAAAVGAGRTFSFSAKVAEDAFSLVATRRACVATTIMTAITYAGRDRCMGSCGPASSICDGIYASDTSAVAAASVVYESVDGGVTFAATAADAFAVDEVIETIVSFRIDKDTMRIMVAVSETVAAQNPQIAYTDDAGVTWTAVDISAVVTEFVPCLFAWSQNEIYAVTDTGAGAAGNIYKSTDGGVTWAASLLGTTDSLASVHFGTKSLGLAVGATNEIQFTSDEGAHWATIAGPAAQAAANCLSCVVIDAQRWFIGYDDGELWYTQDGGDTWAERALPIPGGGTAIASINQIDSIDAYNIWMASEVTIAAAAWPAIMRTFDGGMHWESYLSPALSAAGGMTGVVACDYNQAFGSGGVVAATGLILEAAEA